MDKREFNDLLRIKVPAIIEDLSKVMGISIDEATHRFYSSKIYTLLCNEETKYWWESEMYLVYEYLIEVGLKEDGLDRGC